MPHSSVLRHFFEFDHLFPSAQKYIWENYRFFAKIFRNQTFERKRTKLYITFSLSLMK